jgi:hypothetical protein
LDTLALSFGGKYPAIQANGYAIVTATSAGKMYLYPFAAKNTVIEEGATFAIRALQITDLTKMYNAGEITSYDEYLERKPIGIDEYAPNNGELIDMKVYKLVSTNDNAYDDTVDLIRVLGKKPYMITGTYAGIDFYPDSNPNDSISANRSEIEENGNIITFPENGRIYVQDGEADVCICLSYTYPKPHPEHQQEIIDLSFISEAFPNGMRSAGSAYDEILFNPTKKKGVKIVRVGVRAYAEGDAEDSSVTTDGETTNYPLDDPMSSTIDLSPNFKLDYIAWDFGTEEAFASVPSAPFRADINYEPNAVDDLRWAVAEIRKLKAQLAQVNASVTNLTE